MAHCILNRNQVFPVIQQRRGKGSPQIMRGTSVQAGLALTHLQDMVHRLVGQPLLREAVVPADACEQGARCLAPYLVHPQLQSLPGAGRDICQPFLVPLALDFQCMLPGQDIPVTQCHSFRATQAASEKYAQQRRIPDAFAAAVRLAHTEQLTDFLPAKARPRGSALPRTERTARMCW